MGIEGEIFNLTPIKFEHFIAYHLPNSRDRPILGISNLGDINRSVLGRFQRTRRQAQT